MRYAKLTLIGVFITSLITAQIISSKLLFVTLPFIGAVAMPGGTLAYAFTFLSTDCLGELYGKETATKTVRVAFFMNFVMLSLVFVTIWWPRAGGVPQKMFAGTLAPAVNITLGSLTAYLISQHTDVTVFHALRERTEGDALWLRNIASTGLSQAVDTVVFTVVAFIVSPAILGVGAGLPLSVVTSLIVGQYTVKALIALLDTPVVYGIVRVVQ